MIMTNDIYMNIEMWVKNKRGKKCFYSTWINKYL